MIRTTIFSFLILLLPGLGVACQSQPNIEPRTFAISTATPGSQPYNTARPTLASRTVADYVIEDLPICPGITDLKAPVKFDWPDIENALEKLEEYNWGYYTCAMPQPQLLSLLQDNMPKPPYLWREVNHADYAGGRIVLFYQPNKVIWNYIWTLPGPDKQTSYMFIAKGEPGAPQTWECRRLLPEMQNQASLKASDKLGSNLRSSPSHEREPL